MQDGALRAKGVVELQYEILERIYNPWYAGGVLLRVETELARVSAQRQEWCQQGHAMSQTPAHDDNVEPRRTEAQKLPSCDRSLV